MQKSSFFIYNVSMGYSDLFQSRRTLFARCEWWSQKLITGGAQQAYDYSKLAHKIRPTGTFFAEEINPVEEAPQEMSEVRFTAKTVTIATTDNVAGKIFRDDLVRYDGHIWRVTSITLRRDWKKSQFSAKNKKGTVIIGLRG